MSIKERIEHDIKQAMLAGDKAKVTTLRGLKSAILYVEVAANQRESGLDEAAVIEVLAKEAKKRQESADLYVNGGNQPAADKELSEKSLIETYLPAQLSDAELNGLIDEVVTQAGASGMSAMGQVIGQVKQRTAGQADGARIAQLVKARLMTWFCSWV